MLNRVSGPAAIRHRAEETLISEGIHTDEAHDAYTRWQQAREAEKRAKDNFQTSAVATIKMTDSFKKMYSSPITLKDAAEEKELLKNFSPGETQTAMHAADATRQKFISLGEALTPNSPARDISAACDAYDAYVAARDKAVKDIANVGE